MGEKEVMAMTHTERLIAAGIRPDCAVETVAWYLTQGDACGLERYVAGVETRRNLEVSQR